MSKPKVKLATSGRRQFSPSFKIAVVKEVRRARRKGKRGSIGAILASYQVDAKRLQYWERQYDQGHLMADRAVAFSRQDEMIRG